MRIILSLILLTILPSVESLLESHKGTVHSAFIGFQYKFGKKYESKEEEIKRNAIFQANLHHIEQINARNLSYKLGVNEYTDLTHEEFAALKLGILKMSLRKDDKFVAETDTTQLATSVDWRNKSVLTPIKDQGHCGSCWAFSSTGALEAQYAIATGKLLSLSEQQLVDCSSSYGNHGCNGGWMQYAYDYIKSSGIDQESTYPYEASDNTCQKSLEKLSDGLPVGEVTGYHMLEQTEQALMTRLVAAPVSVAMYASDPDFQFYKSGVYSSDTCNGGLDHAVVAVGYGNENGEDYFIGRNSWGTSWGQDGYFYLKRGVPGYGECTILEYMCVADLKTTTSETSNHSTIMIRKKAS